MEWQNIITTRKTTYTWSDKEVSREIISAILEEMHEYIPSKQSKMPYEISVLDWTNTELRNWIFEKAHRAKEHNIEEDIGNPQVLAPWLIAFSARPDNQESIEKYSNREIFVEIGIASCFVVYAAQSRGLSTGFCGCIQSPSEISDRLYHKNPIQLLLGIGYSDSKDQYLDPRTNTYKDTPANENYNHGTRKPKMDEYIKWI